MTAIIMQAWHTANILLKALLGYLIWGWFIVPLLGWPPVPYLAVWACFTLIALAILGAFPVSAAHPERDRPTLEETRDHLFLHLANRTLGLALILVLAWALSFLVGV